LAISALTTLKLSQKVNVAILRIKEEQDFVDYKLMPYVEILKQLFFTCNPHFVPPLFSD
jgi:hypothetical protein